MDGQPVDRESNEFDVSYSIKYDIEAIKDAMITSIRYANKYVIEEQGYGVSSGTTLSVVVIIDDAVIAANVGDSPIYYYSKKNEKIDMIAKLQTQAEQEVKMGKYERNTEEDYYTIMFYIAALESMRIWIL